MVIDTQISIGVTEDEPLNILSQMEGDGGNKNIVTKLAEMESQGLHLVPGVDATDILDDSSLDKEKNYLVGLAQEKGYDFDSEMQETLAKLKEVTPSVRQSKRVSTH